jgi:hypothetical protein
MSSITSKAEYDVRYRTIPLERWRNNIIEACKRIGDQSHQETHWTKNDRPAWENPNEVINVLFDDSSFELFLTDCAFSLSELQLIAGQDLLHKLNNFLANTPQSLDATTTLADPDWKIVRITARRFVDLLGSN